MSTTEAQQIAELEKQIAELEAFKANCKCQKPRPPKQEKKKKKNKVCKSDFIIQLTPAENCDWKKVEEEVRAIEIDGLMWATVFSLVDFVYGMKAMNVGAQIEDLMVPETAPIVAQLQALDGVEKAELTNIQTAQADWGGKSSGKAPKKKKNKKKKEEPKMEITEVEITKAGNKIAIAARESDTYAGDVADLDRSGAMDVTEAQLRSVAEIVSKQRPELIYILIAAGKTKCSILGYVPASRQEEDGADATAMVNGSFFDDVKVNGDKTFAFGEFVCDADKNQFALKEKDNCMTCFFKYLNTSGLDPDDSDSDDSVCGLDSDDE